MEFQSQREEVQLMLGCQYVALAALPIAAFVGSELLIGLWGPWPSGTGMATAIAGTWTEASLRVNMLALFLLFLVCSVGVIVKVVLDLHRDFRPGHRAPLWWIFATCATAGVVMIGLTYWGNLPRSFDLVGRAVFDKALEESIKPGAYRRLWATGSISSMLGAINVVALIAVASLVTAGISCLGERDGLNRVENWRFQADRLRTYIYMSASFLIVGVLCAKAWTQYPGFLLDAAGQKDFLTHINALAMFLGVEQSILLASFALPVAAVLSRKADKIARDEVKAESGNAGTEPTYSEVLAAQEKWKLMASTQDVLKSLTAVLAPFLTGTVASLSSLIH